MPKRVTLLTRPGCHLCDDARAVVTNVVAGVPGASLEERSIEDDAALLAAYTDDVPVVLVDGRWHARWRIDPVALRAALA